MTTRSNAKRAVERLLRVVAGNPARMRGRSLILAYHNVVPDRLQGFGERSLHLPLTRFRQQLDLLQATCRVLPLAELLAGPTSEDAVNVAITFDDAYRGAVELALPEVSRRGLPSTLFVAPGLLGTRSFWWDELAGQDGALAPEFRRLALQEDGGRQERIRARVGAHASGLELPSCYGCATEQDLLALAKLTHVTFGAHSWGHPNLASIGPTERALELSRPLEWLRARSLQTLPVLAYPYGMTSPSLERVVQAAGYLAALLVEGGWYSCATDRRWAIPRSNVPAGISEDGFLLRLSGVIAP